MVISLLGQHPPPSTDDEFAGCRYKYDSIVRVIGAEDEDLNDCLMAVVGFERGDAHGEGDGGDVVVLRHRNTVVRVSSEYVYTVLT